MKHLANLQGALTARMRAFRIWKTVKGTSHWASSWDCTRKRIPREISAQRRPQGSQMSWASGLVYIHIPYLNQILILCRLTRPRRLTKLRTTFLSLLASQWMIFPSPQSDLHRMISVMDVHGVEANAQTQLLVPRILYLHEYWALMPFFVLFIHFIFMRKHHSLFQLPLMVIHVLITTRHDFYDSSWSLCFAFAFLYLNLAFYYGAKKHNEIHSTLWETTDWRWPVTALAHSTMLRTMLLSLLRYTMVHHIANRMFITLFLYLFDKSGEVHARQYFKWPWRTFLC